MKKSIGLLSLISFILVTCFAGSAYAVLEINWFHVQKRTYEDGRQFNRIQVGVNDQNLVKDITLYKNDTKLDVDIDDFTWYADTHYWVDYDCYNGIWHRREVGPGWNVVYNFFWNSSFDLEEGALYTIVLDSTEGGTVSRSKLFTEVVELPIVSLTGRGKQKKSKKNLMLSSWIMAAWL